MGAADRVITHFTRFRIDAVFNEANKWVIKYLRAGIEVDFVVSEIDYSVATIV
jgi:hypothetical protein